MLMLYIPLIFSSSSSNKHFNLNQKKIKTTTEMSSKTVATAVAEAIHNIRRLSSNEDDDWYPFESKKEFNLNIVAAASFLVLFVISAIVLDALVKCLYDSSHHPSPADIVQQKLSLMCMGPIHIFTLGISAMGFAGECAICLSEFVQGEHIRILPKCKHGFHVNCIESWLINRSSCPTCRRSCLRTSAYHDSPEDQQQQSDVDAANPPETDMVVPQQQELINDVGDIEAAANPPESEIVQIQQLESP